MHDNLVYPSKQEKKKMHVEVLYMMLLSTGTKVLYAPGT